MSSTKSTNIGDTVEFYHSNHKMPTISNTDAIIDSATQLVKTLSFTLTNNKNKMRALHDNHSKHIKVLSSILSEIANKNKITLTYNLFSLNPIPSMITHHIKNLAPKQLITRFQHFHGCPLQFQHVQG